MLFGSFRYRRKASSEAGYLYLVILLLVVFMVIGALALGPAVTGELKRERENEMIHRGVQYSRAVKKYYKKFGAYPTTVDQLLNTNNIRFLRQKYKDPMSAKGEWRLLHYGDVQMGGNQFGSPGAGGTTGGTTGTASSGFGQSSSFGQSSGFGQSSSGFGQSSSGFGQSSFGQSSSNNSANSNTPTPTGGATSGTGDSSAGGTTAGGAGSTTASGTTDSSNNSNIQTTGSSSSSGSSSSFGSSPGGFGTSTTGASSTFGGGGILGVASLSPKQSIHRFDDKDHYKDWKFIYDPTMDRGGLITQPYSTKPPLGFAGQGQVAQQGTQQPGSSFGGSSVGGSSFGGSSFGNSGSPQSGSSYGGSQNQMAPSMPPDTTPH